MSVHTWIHSRNVDSVLLCISMPTLKFWGTLACLVLSSCGGAEFTTGGAVGGHAGANGSAAGVGGANDGGDGPLGGSSSGGKAGAAAGGSHASAGTGGSAAGSSGTGCLVGWQGSTCDTCTNSTPVPGSVTCAEILGCYADNDCGAGCGECEYKKPTADSVVYVARDVYACRCSQ